MKSMHLLKSAVIGGLLLTTVSANAQMVGSDVFLRGQYLEIGIGNLGYYGSGGNAPSGYHPHGFTNLGFVADPAMDGWTVGTPPYMGDYFLPGSPFEGWELQVNGKRALSYNNGPGTTFAYGGGMGACTGGNVSYTASGSTVSGVWQGLIDSIILTQTTSFDTLSLYFNVQITLTNTAYAPKNNIYYIRTLDPDNDETWPGGSFNTNNVIDHQVKDTTVVTATGLSSSAPTLSLGTTDTNATAVIYNSWPLSVYLGLDSIYNQTYTTGTYYTQGVNYPGDIAIGLLVYVPHLATVDSATDSLARTTGGAKRHPANSATFNYFYAFSPAAVDSAIVNANKTTPVTPPGTGLGVNNINAVNDVKVYPNPSKNIINIAGLDMSDNITMYDMMGRTVHNNWEINSRGINTFSMNNIAAGSYLIVVGDANGNIKARVPMRKL